MNWTFFICCILDIFAIYCWLTYFAKRNKIASTITETVLETIGFSLGTASLVLLTVTILVNWWTADLVGIPRCLNTVASIGGVLGLLCAPLSLFRPSVLRVAGVTLSIAVSLTWLWYLHERIAF